MSLTRQHLESGYIRRIFAGRPDGPRCLTDDEHRESIDALLADHCPECDIWVFGYGSLVWNPLFRFAERRVATVHGFHRRFCLWSMTGRGTPENPGLVLGLDRGGRCTGVLYRIPRKAAADELFLLWRREMVVGSYEPRWMKVRDRHGHHIRAITFIVRRDHPNYAGKLPTERVAATMSTACGAIGPCTDYLAKTVEALAEHGIRDAHLAELHGRVFGSRGPRTDPS